jgi:suppressor for copper-sensitivity B
MHAVSVLPRCAFAALALLLACLPGPALAQPLGGLEKATVELVTDRTAYEPGETARAAAILTIEEGWHTNSHQPTYDYLIPTEVRLHPPEGWPEAIEIRYPPGEMKSFAFADEPLSVYEGEVAVLAPVAVPVDAAPSVHELVASVTYQACDDRSCLPPVTVERTVALSVGSGGESNDHPAFGAIALPPGPASGSTVGTVGLMLLLGLVGGLILNAMPCVLPVLSLKVFGLVQSAGRGRREVVFGSLATAAGILLSFWALALLAIGARSAGGAVGWGVQFQEPGFVAALALVMVLFSLNLWGLFEIPLPARLARLADSGPKEGVGGHLLSGLFATLMATPCSAPFLGTAVGFALAQEATTILAIFTAVGLGMALPYLLLAAAPGLVRLLPRPGAWMVAFKALMGFLLAAAAVWLLYVLASQVSPERLAFFQLALLALAFFVWVRGHVRRPGARALALVGALAAVVGGVALAATAPASAVSAVATEQKGRIPWEPFDRTEAQRLAAGGRLVFVDVTADWCFTCKVNERLVLETTTVADAFARHEVYPMKADWTNRDDEIAAFLAEHGRYGIPFYLLYRPGTEPHLFSELLTQEAVLTVLEEAGSGARRAAAASPTG